MGWAPDYLDGLIRIANHGKPDDFVHATGTSHSVRDFVVSAFAAAGIDDWTGHVEVDHSLPRPADSVELVGDASKARRELGGRPTKGFEQIVEAMVRADLDALGGIDQSPPMPTQKGRT